MVFVQLCESSGDRRQRASALCEYSGKFGASSHTSETVEGAEQRSERGFALAKFIAARPAGCHSPFVPIEAFDFAEADAGEEVIDADDGESQAIEAGSLAKVGEGINYGGTICCKDGFGYGYASWPTISFDFSVISVEGETLAQSFTH